MSGKDDSNRLDKAPTWLGDRQEYEMLARRICRCARLTTKDNLFWSLSGKFLSVVSLGRFTAREFNRRFATTFGPIQAYPRHWDSLSKAIIAHESRHTAQFLFAGWFVPILGWCPASMRVWIGVLPMALAYGFFPLPIGLAWGRYRLELDAESFAWRIGLAEGWMTADEVRLRAERLAANLSGSAYLWAWPRAWTRRGLIREANRTISQNVGAENDGAKDDDAQNDEA